MFMVHLTWRASRAFDPFDLAGDDHGTAVSFLGDNVSATITLEAPTPGTAVDEAIEHCLGIIPGTLVRVEVEA